MAHSVVMVVIIVDYLIRQIQYTFRHLPTNDTPPFVSVFEQFSRSRLMYSLFSFVSRRDRLSHTVRNIAITQSTMPREAWRSHDPRHSALCPPVPHDRASSSHLSCSYIDLYRQSTSPFGPNHLLPASTSTSFLYGWSIDVCRIANRRISLVRSVFFSIYLAFPLPPRTHRLAIIALANTDTYRQNPSPFASRRLSSAFMITSFICGLNVSPKPSAVYQHYNAS